MLFYQGLAALGLYRGALLGLRKVVIQYLLKPIDAHWVFLTKLVAWVQFSRRHAEQIYSFGQTLRIPFVPRGTKGILNLERECSRRGGSFFKGSKQPAERAGGN